MRIVCLRASSSPNVSACWRAQILYATCLGNFCQEVLTTRWEYIVWQVGLPPTCRTLLTWLPTSCKVSIDLINKVRVPGICTSIIEVCCASPIHLKSLRVSRLELPTSLDLSVHVAPGVFAAHMTMKQKFGTLEHFKLFQLTGRSAFTRHDVNRRISQVGNGTVALSNPCSFDENEIKIVTTLVTLEWMFARHSGVSEWDLRVAIERNSGCLYREGRMELKRRRSPNLAPPPLLFLVGSTQSWLHDTEGNRQEIVKKS